MESKAKVQTLQLHRWFDSPHLIRSFTSDTDLHFTIIGLIKRNVGLRRLGICDMFFSVISWSMFLKTKYSFTDLRKIYMFMSSLLKITSPKFQPLEFKAQKYICTSRSYKHVFFVWFLFISFKQWLYVNICFAMYSIYNLRFYNWKINTMPVNTKKLAICGHYFKNVTNCFTSNIL